MLGTYTSILVFSAIRVKDCEMIDEECDFMLLLHFWFAKNEGHCSTAQMAMCADVNGKCRLLSRLQILSSFFKYCAIDDEQIESSLATLNDKTLETLNGQIVCHHCLSTDYSKEKKWLTCPMCMTVTCDQCCPICFHCEQLACLVCSSSLVLDTPLCVPVNYMGGCNRDTSFG